MATMQLRFNTRKQLVDALEARRLWAEKYDAEMARQHRRDEGAVLTKFRARCRDLGKLNLVRLKEAVEAMEYREMSCGLPSCPMSAVAMLDDALSILAITKQEKFVLNGDYKDTVDRAHWLLTHDEAKSNRTVCA